ncbi:MAG: DUF3108 domain-containing protein [Gemmatimonas sp.]
MTPIIRTKGLFSEGGETEVWFSNDARHLPLRARVSIATLTIDLKCVTAGSPLSLRCVRDDPVTVCHSCARALGGLIALDDDTPTQALECNARRACDDIHGDQLLLVVRCPRDDGAAGVALPRLALVCDRPTVPVR